MSDFRVKHYEYFNENGKVANEYYFIQQRIKFLWKYYWEDIKHEECVWGDCYKTRTTFATLEEAQQFIREVLCPELPRNKSRIKEVEIITCKND
jgi:hypothetical protein